MVAEHWLYKIQSTHNVLLNKITADASPYKDKDAIDHDGYGDCTPTQHIDVMTMLIAYQSTTTKNATVTPYKIDSFGERDVTLEDDIIETQSLLSDGTPAIHVVNAEWLQIAPVWAVTARASFICDSPSICLGKNLPNHVALRLFGCLCELITPHKRPTKWVLMSYEEKRRAPSPSLYY
eukprot:1920395-Amphidinium_carterae.1